MASRQELVERFRAHWQPRREESLTLLLSGGGDSTALFFLLCEAGYGFGCWHFRHDSPGSFADRSADFCRELCARHGVPLEVKALGATSWKQRGDLSWLAAASCLRYRDIEGRAGLFLTAHTADDQAETLLMRLLDGAGLAGLAGIRATRGEQVARPLLTFRRAELREFLQSLGERWLDDPGNVEGNDRARLRHRLLPLLEAEYPGLVATLGRTARTLAADEEALTLGARDWLARHTEERDHWPVEELRAVPPAVRYRVFREIWRAASVGARRPLGGVFRECERLVTSDSDDRQVIFPGGCSLRKLGGWLWLQPPCESIPWSYPVPNRLELPLEASSWRLLPPGTPMPEGEWLRATVSSAVFEQGEPYQVRSRRAGDVFAGRSLKKMLAATAHPPWVRDRWPLLVRGAEVVAIPGFAEGEPDGTDKGCLIFRPGTWRWGWNTGSDLHRP